jgi:N-acetylated-alpha-linked acidic dipeptidase
VYVNYATEADLDRLAALGVNLQGCIALARYGTIFRGNKVLNVQRRGAAGCLLYCDPFDDGYYRGDVYPAGPMRPLWAVQQGSLHCGPPGDPTKTDGPALPGAAHREPQDVPWLPRIPSLPIRADVAAELLRQIGLPDVPQEWQGALPLRYHVGPGPVQVRLRVAHDGQRRKIWNTFGHVTGSHWPDEQIIIGAHRDSWAAGAADNISGVVSVLEAARLCAALAARGYPPRRTVVFATWDAEEWGIVGSGEFAKHHGPAMAPKLVAYLNQDMVGHGVRFGAAGSPSLHTVLRGATSAVPHPDDPARTVWQAWCAAQSEPPTLRVPSGGSDHEAFLFRLGVPCAMCGFGGPMGVYHSICDSTAWLERFGDPEYRRHSAAAQLIATLALRLADADILPLDFEPYAAELDRLIDKVAQDGGDAPADVAPVRAAGDAWRTAARQHAAALNGADLAALPAERLARCNELLRGVEAQFLREPPPDADPVVAFLRHSVFGLDPHNGYGGLPLPGVSLAAGDASRRAAAWQALAERIRAAAAQLAAATAELNS